MTNGGTFGANWQCIDGDGCYNSSSNVPFNTANLLPAGAYSVSTSCGFDVVDSSFFGGDGVGCSADPLNNAGTTNVNIHMVSGDGPSACCTAGQSSADVTNVTLTVTWYNPVSVTVYPSAITVPAGQGCAASYNSLLNASVDSPNTAATWRTSPASVGYFCNLYATGPNGVFYVPPAAVDATTTITAIATSVADPSKSGSASVTIVPGPLTVSVAPSSALLYAGQTRQFSATVTNRLTTGVNWSISPTIGTISPTGLYTAPSPVPAQQAVTVTASSVLDGSKYATALVQLERPMPTGLVAWWPGDGNTLDVVTGAAASVIGNLSYGSGKVNQAFMVQYNSAIQSNSPGAISGARTLTAWVNPMANRGYHMSIVAGGGDDFGLNPQGSQYSLAVNSVTSTSTVAPNVWTHVAMTYDGSTIRLYLNGTLVQSAAGALANYNLNTYQLGSGFYDSLDEIQVYNRALSQAEIAQAMSPITVTVSPASGRIYGGQQATFTATVANTGVLTTGVTWSLGSGNPGSINAAGVYQAPATVSSTQQITIVATSAADPSRAGTASMTLSVPVAVSIAAPGTMWPSQIQQLTATVGNADNTAVTWTMASGPGAINAYGVYTSPYAVSGTTTATVRATSVQDPTKSATATVTINPWGAGTPYQYFVSDPMTTANPALWGMNGSATVTPAGIIADAVYGGGSAISQAAIPDGTNDYEVRATVHLTNPISNGTHSYSVLARASANAMLGQYQQALAGQGTLYAFTMVNPWWSTGCAATMYLSKMVNGSVTVLSQFPFPCHDGMTMGMVVRDVAGAGTQITLSVDSAYTSTVTDSSSPITSGKPGVSLMPATGTTISKVEIGNIDRAAPGVVSGGGASAFANRVELQWQAAADDNGGSGVVGYQISRGGTYLGTAGGTQYTDETGTVADRTAYTITAFDRHGNSGAGTTLTAPAVSADARRIGVRPTGAYWGAAGEQIDY